MNEILEYLKSIENTLEQCASFSNDGSKIISEYNRNYEAINNNEIYDFQDLDEVSEFTECDKENWNSETFGENLGKLKEVEVYIGNLVDRFCYEREKKYQEFMGQFKEMSKRISAVYSLNAFVRRWETQMANKYDLTEYPDLFKKCLEAIPTNERNKIVKNLSKIKPIKSMDEIDKSSTILKDFNESNKIQKSLGIDLSSDFSNESSNNTFKFEGNLSDGNNDAKNYIKACDISFIPPSPTPMRQVSSSTFNTSPSYLVNICDARRNKIHRKSDNTPNFGTSLMEFTQIQVNSNTSNDELNSSNKYNHLDTNCSFIDLMDEDELNDSNSSQNPLNQAIFEDYNNSREEFDFSSIIQPPVSDEQKTRTEFPSFLNDSARIPDIEHYTTGNGFDTMRDIVFETSVNVTGLQSIRDDSINFPNDSSIGMSFSEVDINEDKEDGEKPDKSSYIEISEEEGEFDIDRTQNLN